MVGRLRTILSTSTLLIALLLAVPPAQSGSAVHCEASTILWDDSTAECDIPIDQCSGTCITYEIAITVTADPSLDGLATPYVFGYIAGEQICDGIGSCTGTTTFTESTVVGLIFACEGTGLEGQDLSHTTTSLTVTCDRTVA